MNETRIKAAPLRFGLGLSCLGIGTVAVASAPPSPNRMVVTPPKRATRGEAIELRG